jgi:hypothetical protein
VQPYSPERRTALVLCGTGAHGAYHAGVLRAVQEAGVKVDVMAGQGVGALAASLAAIDGGSRLWDADGLWKSERVRALYGWKWPLRAAAWSILIVTAVLVAPLLFLAAGGGSVPVVVPRIALIVLILAAAVVAAGVATAEWHAPAKRRAEGAWWWRAIGAPLDTRAAHDLCLATITQLIPGAGPRGPALGRRYAEVLADSLGQPGFRELMIVATDLDSRRDVIAALLREPYRREFLAPRLDRERRSEVLDLAGHGRDHALDMVAAALTPPLACDPHLLTFAPDSYWRGETHRFCDRPGAVSRLLEELASAGVSQVVIATAVSPVPAPHRLRAARIDVRQRLADFLAAAEMAALRDAIEMARLRFDSVYLICPAHNPVGAFDFGGAYDESSDRRQDVPELMDRAYEDAYRQFIEPVVGASGEHLARAASTGHADDHARTLHDADPPR